MRSAKVRFLDKDVEVFYSGSGSDLVIEEIVDAAGKEIELPHFASPESVFLYADVSRADYEANAEHLEFLSEHVKFIQVR